MEGEEEEKNKGDSEEGFSLSDYLEITGKYLKKVAIEGKQKIISFVQNLMKDDKDE
jgi:hypothetical protein